MPSRWHGVEHESLEHFIEGTELPKCVVSLPHTNNGSVAQHQNAIHYPLQFVQMMGSDERVAPSYPFLTEQVVAQTDCRKRIKPVGRLVEE